MSDLPNNVSALPSRDDIQSFRSSPSNLEAEQALLGAILVNNDIAAQVGSFLSPDDYFEPVHARIYESALRLIDRGQIANPTTLRALFERDEALADIGGADYLRRLANAAVTIINSEDYGRVIHDLSQRRQLIRIGEDMVNTAYDPTVDAESELQIEAAEQRLYNLAEKGRYEGGFKAFSAALAEAVQNAEAALKRDGHLTGVTTGLRDLDSRLGGLHRSDLIILAGRPGMGKSALAANIGFSAAKAHLEKDGHDNDDGAAIAFFSLEMSAEQLASRMLAEETNIPTEKLRRGQFTSDDFIRIAQAAQRIEDCKFFIDDTPAISIATLRARARRLKRQHDIGMIIVDYLQLVRPASAGRESNRVQEVSEITQGLKAIAKELDIPVVALAQLSRQVEQRDDKRPQLADLRESGAIEQDADVVMFIFREEYYHDRTRPDPSAPEFQEWSDKMQRVQGIAEVIIGKHRHGPTGTVRLLFNGQVTKFSNLAEAEMLPEHY